MKVYLMRGLPGSGKSTWARRKFLEVGGNGVWISADDYHTDADGVYLFRRERAGEAHNSCLRRFLEALSLTGCELVIVDNTNLSAWEIAPYYRLAEVFGVEVEIVYFPCTVEKSIARNTHQVPEATIQQMAARIDSLPRGGYRGGHSKPRQPFFTATRSHPWYLSSGPGLTRCRPCSSFTTTQGTLSPACVTPRNLNPS